MDPSTGHRERRPWTEEEDQLLRDAIQREDPAANPPSKWHAIAMHVPSRTNKDCRKRWWAQMATTVAKGGWSAEEDDRLCLAVDEFGTKWALVATRVGTRNSGQCAKRWNDALNPSIDRSEWTDEEDVKLLEAVKTQGKSWTNIVRQYLPGRTGLAAKNRYNHLTRATTDRGRERRKTQTQPYTRSLNHIPAVPPAPASSGSTPPHLSREHTPLTPADIAPPLYGHYGPPPGALKPEPELAFERPTLSLAGMPSASPAPYSPHLAQSHGSMYPPPTPAYRLAPSPSDSPRSAYPGPTPTSYFPPTPADLHRGGYHSQPATPATTNSGTAGHGPGYFAPGGVSGAHAAHLARAHQHGIALYPTPEHAHASHASAGSNFELRQYDAHGSYRLPSMQAVGGEWAH